MLTRHCNEISDSFGQPTYVIVIGNSLKLFLNEGFGELGQIDTLLEEYGGENVLNRNWYLRREAQKG